MKILHRLIAKCIELTQMQDSIVSLLLYLVCPVVLICSKWKDVGWLSRDDTIQSASHIRELYNKWEVSINVAIKRICCHVVVTAVYAMIMMWIAGSIEPGQHPSVVAVLGGVYCCFMGLVIAIQGIIQTINVLGAMVSTTNSITSHQADPQVPVATKQIMYEVSGVPYENNQ